MTLLCHSVTGPECCPYHHGDQHWHFCHQHYRSLDTGRRPWCVSPVRIRTMPLLNPENYGFLEAFFNAVKYDASLQGLCWGHCARFFQLAVSAGTAASGGGFWIPLQAHRPPGELAAHSEWRASPPAAQRHHRPAHQRHHPGYPPQHIITTRSIHGWRIHTYPLEIQGWSFSV